MKLRPSTRPEIGTLWIAGAVALGIVSMLFQYTWAAFLPSSVPAAQESSYLTLHSTWIPLSGVALVAASAVLLGGGFLLIWRERAPSDPERRTLLRLAGLGFSGTFAAAVLKTSLGLILGSVYAPQLRVPLLLVDVGLAIALGLTLYWLLLGMGIGQARIAGIVALVAGSLGSSLAVLPRLTQVAGVDAIGLAAGFLSLTLWLALFLWGYDELRLRGHLRPPALPA